MQDVGWGNVAEDAVLLGLSENSPGPSGPSGPSGSSGGDLASRPGMPRGRPVGMIGSKWLRGIWRRDGHHASLSGREARPILGQNPESVENRIEKNVQSTSLACLARGGVMQGFRACLDTAQSSLLECVKSCWHKIENSAQGNQGRATAASIALGASRPVGSTKLSFSLAAARDFEGSERTFVRDRQRVSMCNLHFAPMSWRVLLQAFQRQIDSKDLVPMCVYKSRRYDETPTKLKLPGKLPADRRKVLGKPAGGVTAKVFQSKLEVAFLMHSKNLDKHILFRSSIPCPLQLVDSCTIPNVRWLQMQVEERIPGLQHFSQQFALKFSLPATDRHFSNQGAEKALSSDDNGWNMHHFLCDAHKAAQVQKVQFELLTGNVSAMLMFSVATRQGNSLNELKAILMQLIEDRVDIHLGQPPPEYTVYRRAVRDLFLAAGQTAMPESRRTLRRSSGSENSLRRRVILEHLCNGNLQRNDVIEFWMPTADFATREQVVHVLQEWLVPALLPGPCPAFPRSRWTGADLSVDFFGLLQSHHGLLRPLIQQWTQGRTSVDAPLCANNLPPLPALDSSVGWAPLAANAQNRPEVDEQPNMAVPQPEALQVAASNAAGAGAADPDLPVWYQAAEAVDVDVDMKDHVQADSGDVDWASFNAALKAKLGRWCQRATVEHAFVVMRAAMKAPLKLLRDVLTFAGSAWEQKQAALKATTGTRSYRVSKAADGSMQGDFMRLVQQGFHQQLASLPANACLRSTRVLLFRKLARAGAAAEQLMFAEHRAFPFKLFTALGGNIKSFDEQPCMLDRLSFTVTRQRYSDLQTPEAQACLHGHASCARS